MIRFLLNALLTAIATAAFLDWGQAQGEAQLDKMQQKVDFTPGAETPLPPTVVLAGAALLSGQLLAARILRLRGWQTLFSLLLGTAAGLVLFVNQSSDHSQ
ncbi:MAG: hypothetical protein DCC55_14450 [Chloroflexi bacterium]|nr:MAG: hypothetical protein DCC55_14450 [Chloroflexota bacterium]